MDVRRDTESGELHATLADNPRNRNHAQPLVGAAARAAPRGTAGDAPVAWHGGQRPRTQPAQAPPWRTKGLHTDSR